MDDIQSAFRQEIERSHDRNLEMRTLVLRSYRNSQGEGRMAASTMDLFLDGYKEMVKIITYLELYNRLYPGDSKIEQLIEGFLPALKENEEGLKGILGIGTH